MIRASRAAPKAPPPVSGTWPTNWAPKPSVIRLMFLAMSLTSSLPAFLPPRRRGVLQREADLQVAAVDHQADRPPASPRGPCGAGTPAASPFAAQPPARS